MLIREENESEGGGNEGGIGRPIASNARKIASQKDVEAKWTEAAGRPLAITDATKPEGGPSCLGATQPAVSCLQRALVCPLLIFETNKFKDARTEKERSQVNENGGRLAAGMASSVGDEDEKKKMKSRSGI